MLLYVEEKISYASICRKVFDDCFCCFTSQVNSYGHMKKRPAMLLYVEKTSYASICRGEDQLCFYM